MECGAFKGLITLIVIAIIICALFYFMSRDIRLFFDKYLFYKNHNLFLIEGSWSEFIFVIVLKEVSNETVLIKQYEEFGIKQKIIKKSQLIKIKDS